MRERLIFLFLPFAVVVALTFPTTTDDPFITLRYAANLVHGVGPVYNSGQHVQGFTSPLHLLVATVVYLSPGAHVLFKLKIVSLLFGVLALRQGSMLLVGLQLPTWLRRVSFVALGSSVTLAFASSNALETSLVLWLLTSLVRRLILLDPAEYGLQPTILAFALVFARFDSLVPVALMAATGLWLHRELPWWRRSSWAAGAVAAAILSMIGQYLYYGFPFPNTYYAKAQSLGPAIRAGLTYLATSIVPSLGHSGMRQVLTFFFVITGIVLFCLGTFAIVRRTQRCAYLLALVSGQVLFILKSGGDWMVGGRFIAPAVIPLIAIEVLGLAEVTRCLQRCALATAVGAARVVASAGLIGASFLPLTGHVAPIWRMSGLDDKSILADGHIQYLSGIWAGLPDALHCVKAGQTVATSEAGFLGFYRQDVRVLDMRGLTDQEIAHTSGHPLFLVRNSAGITDLLWESPTSPVGREIIRQDPSVIATFDLLGTQPAIGTSILGGTYRLLDYLLLPGGAIALFGNRFADRACFAETRAAEGGDR